MRHYGLEFANTMNIKIKLLPVVLALLMMGSDGLFAALTPAEEAIIQQDIVDEINKRIATGKLFEDAVKEVIESFARRDVMKSDSADAARAVYEAISEVAKAEGIDRYSTVFTKAVASATDEMIKVTGVSRAAVESGFLAANIPHVMTKTGTTISFTAISSIAATAGLAASESK